MIHLLPIIEEIARSIHTAVESVRVTNGYHLDVGAVTRPSRGEDFTPSHKAVLLQQDQRAQVDETQGSMTKKTWVQPFLLDLFVRLADVGDEPIDSFVNLFAADVEKAVMARRFSGPSAFGVPGCIDGRMGDPVNFIEVSGAFHGVQLVVDVTYAHLELDPYNDGGA